MVDGFRLMVIKDGGLSLDPSHDIRYRLIHLNRALHLFKHLFVDPRLGRFHLPLFPVLVLNDVVRVGHLEEIDVGILASEDRAASRLELPQRVLLLLIASPNLRQVEFNLKFLFVLRVIDLVDR